jgi:hypothetical protein
MLFTQRSTHAPLMYVDSRENGIPFSSAYQNFVADMLGLGLCLLLSHFTFRDPQGSTRTDYAAVEDLSAASDQC